MANIENTTNVFNGSLVLENCFKKIINGESVEIDVSHAYDFLNNLHVNITGLQPKIRTILPFLLIHFMKSWPGWHKNNAYFHKEITFEEWFKKFEEYLSFKLNYVIKNDIEDIYAGVEQLSIDSSFLIGIDNSTQTDTELEKTLAPYSIEIEAPPRYLNTMVFVEGLNNDIILKEYNTNVEWTEKLTIRQLINWPNIEIEFNSKELHFKRCNVHDVQRFLGFGTYKLPTKKQNEGCILEMDIIDTNITRKSYSLNLIKEYCNLYISLLKIHQEKIKWSNNNVNQVEVILEDLILDLIDINKNSIATNTKVTFNIGNCTYDRNKSAKKSVETVKLTDVVTPNTLLSFISFTAFIDSGLAPFPVLKEIEKGGKFSLLTDILPSICYRCTFCDREFFDDEQIWLHLKDTHAMELPVLCFRCEQQFTIPTLTQHRWRHQCLKNAKLHEKT